MYSSCLWQVTSCYSEYEPEASLLLHLQLNTTFFKFLGEHDISSKLRMVFQQSEEREESMDFSCGGHLLAVHINSCFIPREGSDTCV